MSDIHDTVGKYYYSSSLFIMLIYHIPKSDIIMQMYDVTKKFFCETDNSCILNFTICALSNTV